MIRLASCSLVVALAGCPKPAGTTQAPAGAGCPTAAGVYVASFVSQEPGKGRSGWVIPLHAKAVEQDAPDYATIDAAAASAAGVPAAPTGSLWLATASGAPCQAKVGSFYAAKIEGASMTYGVEIDGCAAPSDPEDAGGIVLVSEQAPTGCRFETPRPIAGRLGDTDASKKWQRPTKETALPAELVAVLPQKSCTAPACETLWAFAEVRIDNRPIAWTGAINWLQINNEPDPCAWPAERESGFWIATPSGPSKVTEGQDHSLPLIAVLADGGGAKVALAEANGVFVTYDLAPGRAALGHRVVWMLAPPQAREAVDHLGPICDEDRD